MSAARFDPYALLRELESRHVGYVIVGGLARVLRGSDELTRNVDLTPSAVPQNLDRLQEALETLGAANHACVLPQSPPKRRRHNRLSLLRSRHAAQAAE